MYVSYVRVCIISCMAMSVYASYLAWLCLCMHITSCVAIESYAMSQLHRSKCNHEVLPAIIFPSPFQLYPQEDYLTGDDLLMDYDPECIAMVTNLLSPDGVNIMWLSKSFLSECSIQEKWFGIKYSIQGMFT